MASSKLCFCFRVLTIITACLLWLIGVAILGLSIYLRVDYWINQYVLADDALQAYTTSVYVFIGVGVLIFIFTIVGIFAAARPDKMALIVYLGFLPLLLAGMLSGGVLAYVYREEIENTVKNSDLLPTLIKEKYSVVSRVTHSIDYMQKELVCCGGYSYTDYVESVWANDYQSEKPGERKDMAPLTCCADYKRYEDISYSEYKYCRMYVSDPEETANQLQTPNPNINKKGCGQAFVDFIQENITYPAIIAFVIVGLQILCIVFTALTLYHLKKSPEPREDDVVYEMARTQEKSPYPARGGPYANLYQS
ncbi:tetraspanin-36-like [Mya arenaria]|uniref:tetraspanin-36-like n=1 Tax=Mya arenaria TaxID=6604 RepID=UPI0022E27120|nr:tetraspanin-36-like [Mya arenaria]